MRAFNVHSPDDVSSRARLAFPHPPLPPPSLSPPPPSPLVRAQKHKKGNQGEDRAREKDAPPWWRYCEPYFRALHASDLARTLPTHPPDEDPDLKLPPMGRRYDAPFEDGLPKPEPEHEPAAAATGAPPGFGVGSGVGGGAPGRLGRARRAGGDSRERRLGPGAFGRRCRRRRRLGRRHPRLLGSGAPALEGSAASKAPAAPPPPFAAPPPYRPPPPPSGPAVGGDLLEALDRAEVAALVGQLLAFEREDRSEGGGNERDSDPFAAAARAMGARDGAELEAWLAGEGGEEEDSNEEENLGEEEAKNESAAANDKSSSEKTNKVSSSGKQPAGGSRRLASAREWLRAECAAAELAERAARRNAATRVEDDERYAPSRSVGVGVRRRVHGPPPDPTVAARRVASGEREKRGGYAGSRSRSGSATPTRRRRRRRRFPRVDARGRRRRRGGGGSGPGSGSGSPALAAARGASAHSAASGSGSGLLPPLGSRRRRRRWWRRSRRTRRGRRTSPARRPVPPGTADARPVAIRPPPGSSSGLRGV